MRLLYYLFIDSQLSLAFLPCTVVLKYIISKNYQLVFVCDYNIATVMCLLIIHVVLLLNMTNISITKLIIGFLRENKVSVWFIAKLV
jgi:hypothetical protein